MDCSGDILRSMCSVFVLDTNTSLRSNWSVYVFSVAVYMYLGIENTCAGSIEHAKYPY